MEISAHQASNLILLKGHHYLRFYPVFTNAQVRQRIEKNTDKIGTVPYTNTAGHPNGTWNQEMGYDRINAIKALIGTT